MRRFTAVVGAFLVLTYGGLGGSEAQTVPGSGPPFSEVQAAWTALLDRLLRGDVEGARRYVHTSRQHLFPGRKTVAEWQEFARQMQFCRVEPTPFPIAPDEVIYQLRCQRGSETAESMVGLRRDRDGVWRFVTL